MSATIDSEPGTAFVTAEMNFIAPDDTSPVYYASEAGDRDGALRIADYTRQAVDIHDARAVRPPFRLDRNGFERIDHESAVTDFFDEAQRRTVWETEVVGLIGRHTGAARVFVFDHTLRADSPELREARTVREPASVVHNDYTDRSAPKRLRDFMGDGAEALLARRFAIVQVWRPLDRTVETAPLALCDTQTTDLADLIPTERRAKDRIGEVMQVRYNPAQRWFYYPRLRTDEALLLKTYDSATDGRARFLAHSAFDDPTSPPDASPRESIETRAFAFF
ncbi:MAG: CmcJ/NvfI family oxidoreductase [Alphaproteobacteria bacterium]|jgi:hypothetical protein